LSRCAILRGYPRHKIRREETRVTDNYEECEEDEICVELDKVVPAEVATIFADERVANAVRDARDSFNTEMEAHKREHGAEAAAAEVAERIIKIRVHSW